MPADYFANYHATLLGRTAPEGFSRRALFLRVIPANIAVDLNQRDKRLHFDNSTFLAGTEHIECSGGASRPAPIACPTSEG